MKYYVTWIFVVLLMCSLTSAIGDKPTRGLNVGDVAPNFMIQSTSDDSSFELSTLRGKCVLVSFWAGYDATSRANNAILSNTLNRSKTRKVELVSVSFDTYKSVFDETVRRDGIVTPTRFVDTKGESSTIFKDYKLDKGFCNYLIDANGIIIAKNISSTQLAEYLNKQPA
jgi:peroxiredoxin